MESLDNFLLDYYVDDYYHVLCGDFNAHTSVVSDIDHVSDYVADDDQSRIISDMLSNFTKCNIPIERHSCDTGNVNSYGKKLLDLCKNKMVCIFNGRVGDDLRIGKATTVFNTVVDYIIGSPVLLTMVRAFKVYDFDPLFSDVHCGITFTLKSSLEKERHSPVPVGTKGIGKVDIREKNIKPGNWDKKKTNEYTRNIDREHVLSIIENVDHKTVNETTNELKKVLLDTALKTFPPRSKKFTKKSNSSANLSYDKQCYVARQEYHKAKHKNNVLKTETSYDDMIRKSKKYKQEMKRVQTKEKQDFISKLRNAKTKDSKLYWKILQQRKDLKYQFWFLSLRNILSASVKQNMVMNT